MTSPLVASPEVATSTAIAPNDTLDSNATGTDLTALTIEDHATKESTEPQDAHPEHNTQPDHNAQNHTSPHEALNIYVPPEQPPTVGEDNSAAIPQSPQTTLAQMAQIEALNQLNAANAAYGQATGNGDISAPTMPLTPTNGLAVLPNPLMPMSNHPFDESPYIHDIDETRISAYAKLEFEDGEFYMNTYSVILGRDLAAARAALRREAELQKQSVENDASTREPKTPVRIKNEESRYTRSVVSESGGILREDNGSDSDEHPRKRKHRKASKKSKSTGSSSQRVSRRNSLVQPEGFVEYQAQYPSRNAPETLGAVPVDPASLRPSPNDCPFVGIHPPAATGASGFKAISRQHVKIAYNSRRHLFEAEVIGRNGAFVDDKFHFHNEVVPLKSGSRLQIGGVVVRFVLPDVAIGETGAEHEDYGEANTPYSTGGKEMSFDFEDAPREGVVLEDTSEDESEVEEEEEEEDEDEEQQEEDDEDDSESLSEVEIEEETQEAIPQPPKRRGPGRPPKNGIMSKREERLLKKEREAQERAQQALTEPAVVVKNKVGRPRKHPIPDTPTKTEKRKYTKRKPKDPDGIKQEGSDEERKEKKEKKPARAERSPTPTFNEADLTPEQLAKPQANYVTLIYEALSGSKTGSMSLPQIYRAIQRKYPFFVLRCNTNGWQSSVRHNLSQHHAFRKVQRDGKGWTWGIVEGVSIEKEKKRRATPPPPMMPGHSHQPIYRAGPYQHMMPGPPMAQPDMHAIPPHIPQDPRYPTIPAPVPGYPLHRSSIPGPVAPPTTATTGSYSSPYAPKPEAPTVTVPKPTQEVQQPPTPRQPPPPAQPSDHVSRAIEAFKTSLVTPLKQKTKDAEAIVNSAVDRVLGKTNQSSVPGNPHEDAIIAALRGILSKIPGSNIAPQPRPLAPPAPAPQAAPSPAPAIATPRPPSSVQRPSFMMGSSRPGPPVPRPPMLTPGAGRSNSDSPAGQRPSESMSPAPANNVKSPDNASGTKRPLEEPGEMGDFKRMSTGPALKT